MSIFTSIYNFSKSHAVLVSTIAIIAVVATVVAGRADNKTDGILNTSNIPRVSLVEALTFRTDFSSVSADGVVESASQADLKSQISAPISVVRVSIGDSVSAGQVIAELSNADIRAGLDQARASFALARTNYDTGSLTAGSARQSIVDKIRDSYIQADNALNSQVDQFLYTSSGSGPTLSSFISNPGLDIRDLETRIRNQYLDLKADLPEWRRVVDTLSVSSSDVQIQTALSLSQTNLNAMSRFLTDISAGINEVSSVVDTSQANMVEGWRTIVSAARNSISGAIAGLTATQGSFSGAETQLSVAEAGVKSLEAQLAKTIIRSPIAGRIAALPLRSGELASPGQLIATVVGGGGLEVRAYASGEDLARIKRGARAVIQGSIPGTVTSVAPSVSQTTKKAELKLSITNPATSGLVVGQSVQARIDIGTATTAGTATDGIYLVPIQNVKIVPGDAYVLTVDAESKIVTVPVILGQVRGDFIEVKGGLTDDLMIVSPVYELTEGQTVQVR